ncbi:RND transporter [Candidatus Nitrotoga sp. BS]|uniref:efflux transporter outer membrane subunit n=1 Tax=Candidatus Nitrotoga sp. BS TaxID=2890408 RepID=UPI001EF35644|nr:efflux transporter outer membrane subunit [Candidatus Nitrotoga sp. BS]CAH1188955.1 RND transporter [Candidatus Nitrotoga sp. BS]
MLITKPTRAPISFRFSQIMLWRIAMVASVWLLAACTVGPEYRVPEIDTGKGWSKPAVAVVVDPELATWWRSLGDPMLDQLIEMALAQNLDIRQAQARIAEGRALRDLAIGAKAPTLGADASVNRRRQSKNGPLPIGSIPGLSRDQTIHDVGFDTAWEIDLFGRIRRTVESAEAQLQATEETASDIRISIVAEVARTYLTLRGTQRELVARTASVETLRRITDTVRRRAVGGDLAQSDVDRAQAQFDTAAAVLPGIRARIRAAALGIGVLLGELPESQLALADSKSAEIMLRTIPVGERADVLRRRPDVRSAERRLAATTANIGVATAEWFPRLSISANGGFQALAIDDLFKSTSQTWSIIPLISWRIFDGGRVKAQIRASEERQTAAAHAYEKAVLSALTDAERSLSNYQLSLESVQAQRTAIESARRSYGHAKQRFKFGDIALADLLEVVRSLHEAEDLYAKTHTVAVTDLIALYKALGGGW